FRFVPATTHFDGIQESLGGTGSSTPAAFGGDGVRPRGSFLPMRGYDGVRRGRGSPGLAPAPSTRSLPVRGPGAPARARASHRPLLRVRPSRRHRGGGRAGRAFAPGGDLPARAAQPVTWP